MSAKLEAHLKHTAYSIRTSSHHNEDLEGCSTMQRSIRGVEKDSAGLQVDV